MRRTPESLYQPFVDPSNSFEGIFHSRTGRLLYTLVKVPEGVGFHMEYERMAAETTLSLAPVEGTTDWSVDGTVDTNTYEHLGLPITRARRLGTEKVWGENGPTIYPKDLLLARELGIVEEAGKGEAAGTALYKVDLKLPLSRMLHFFHKVWAPDLAPKNLDASIPSILVENYPHPYRILPQKYPVIKNTAPMTRLVVIKS